MKENITITALDEIAFDTLTAKQFQSISNTTLSKAVTATIFRNGPVEDMHSKGQLSNDDMKTLNKYMVNQLNYLMELYQNNNYHQLMTILSFGAMTASSWDAPEPVTEFDSIDFKKIKERDILSSKQKGMLNVKQKDNVERLTKKCIVIRATELEDIVGEMTGYIPSIFKDENGAIYVGEFCDKDFNVCDVDVNIDAVIESYFGITLRSIHGEINDEDDTFSVWIEY